MKDDIFLVRYNILFNRFKVSGPYHLTANKRSSIKATFSCGASGAQLGPGFGLQPHSLPSPSLDLLFQGRAALRNNAHEELCAGQGTGRKLPPRSRQRGGHPRATAVWGREAGRTCWTSEVGSQAGDQVWGEGEGPQSAWVVGMSWHEKRSPAHRVSTALSTCLLSARGPLRTHGQGLNH